MGITLCMVVKDEEQNLAQCLQSALPHVDEVMIADTGSSDHTVDIIRAMTRTDPVPIALDPANCHSLTPARNALYARVSTEWILYLDADERIAAGSGEALREAAAGANSDIQGFFGQWNTFLPAEPAFEDYKLFLFRRHLRKRGLAHANVQLDIRERGGLALWKDGLRVDHFPPPALMTAKRELYWRRLQQAMRLEPGWLRHNWFAGYMCFQDGDYGQAGQLFAPLIESRSRLFPVEGLNARMVLVESLVRQHRSAQALGRVEEALEFARHVASDFEVKVNRRILPWLTEASRLLRGGDGQLPRSYRFSA